MRRVLPLRSHSPVLRLEARLEVLREAAPLEWLPRVERQANLPVPRLPRHRVTPALSAGKTTSPRWERIGGR